MIQIGFLAYINRKASARSVEREQKRERKKKIKSHIGNQQLKNNW